MDLFRYLPGGPRLIHDMGCRRGAQTHEWMRVESMDMNGCMDMDLDRYVVMHTHLERVYIYIYIHTYTPTDAIIRRSTPIYVDPGTHA